MLVPLPPSASLFLFALLYLMVFRVLLNLLPLLLLLLRQLGNACLLPSHFLSFASPLTDAAIWGPGGSQENRDDLQPGRVK